MHCLLKFVPICIVYCSNQTLGIVGEDKESNVFLVDRQVDPGTNIAVVTFSRQLETSDPSDANLNNPLFLHFGYGPLEAVVDINAPGTNRWVSRYPIQFDCSRDGETILQHCVVLPLVYTLTVIRCYIQCRVHTWCRG